MKTAYRTEQVLCWMGMVTQFVAVYNWHMAYKAL